MHDLEAPAVQGVRKPLDLGAFAAAVQAFHGQESAAFPLRLRAENIQDLHRRMRDLFRTGLIQFLFAAVAVGHAQRMDARLHAALHIEAAVADHPDLAMVFRQDFTDQVLLFRMAVRRADHLGDKPVKTEIFQDLSGGISGLSGDDAQLCPLFPEGAEHGADAGIGPVLIHADSGIACAVDLLRFLRLLGCKTHIRPERVNQRRTDEFAQRRRIRFRKAHLFHRVLHAVPDAFLALCQRSVQIEQDPGVFQFTIHHSQLSFCRSADYNESIILLPG